MWQQEATSRAVLENGTNEGLGDSSDDTPIAFPHDMQMDIEQENIRNRSMGVTLELMAKYAFERRVCVKMFRPPAAALHHRNLPPREPLPRHHSRHHTTITTSSPPRLSQPPLVTIFILATATATLTPPPSYPSHKH
nr:cryptochrome-1-like isoform X1 [Tanacetum cinerariifolium]